MNRPKRIPALLLALALVLGLTTPALAAGQTVAVSTNEPYSSNETISVTLSNVLAVKEMDIIVSYPGEWISETEFYMEFDIMPITVYCLPRTGSVLTVTTNMETNPHHWIGCALVGNDLQTYHGFDCSQIKGPVYELGTSIDGDLVGSQAGPNTTTYNIDFDMVDSFNDRDIYCIYVNYVCEFYFTFSDLSGVPSVPVEEVKEEEPKEEETHTGLYPLFDEHSKSETDVSMGYHYTFTNYTGEAIDGYYLLLSYSPQYHTAQLYEFDIKLQPGQSTSGTLYSQSVPLSDREFAWIIFDSKEERDGVLNSSALRDVYGQCYVIEDEQWMKDTFGITY